MSHPLVSIIIPTYNRAKYLGHAIDSALKQTFDDHEIIIIDDGSTDDTREVVKQYGQRVRNLYQNNGGVSAARNTGIREAKGEWVAFLDDDDEWLPDYLSFQIARALQNPAACMHMTNSEEVSQDGGKTNAFQVNGIAEKLQPGMCLLIERPFQFVIEKHITALQSTMVRRQSLLKAGLFDSSLSIAEDLDMLARVAFDGPLGICNNVLVCIYRRDEPIGKNLTSQLFLKGIHTHRCFGSVYKKLMLQTTLSEEEKLAVERKLSRNQRALGNMFFRDDKLREARECYKEALHIHPSIASVLRYFLSFLPYKISLRLIFKGRHVKP